MDRRIIDLTLTTAVTLSANTLYWLAVDNGKFWFWWWHDILDFILIIMLIIQLVKGQSGGFASPNFFDKLLIQTLIANMLFGFLCI